MIKGRYEYKDYVAKDILRIEKIFRILIYLVLISIIMVSYLDKYLFLLDSVPIINDNQILELFYHRVNPEYGGSLPIDIIMMLAQARVLILFILFFSAYSMYGLIGKITSSKYIQFYSGILYIFNPYTYIRIMSGQWFLLSYAIFPLLLKIFIDLLEKKEKKEMVKFIFLLSLVSFNTHMMIIALITMTIIFIFWFYKHRDIKISKIFLLSVIIFILLNFYWIFPLITAKNTIIDNIGEEDFKVFAPKIDNLSDLFNIASMYGFWREGYIYAKDFIPYWQLLSLFIILLAVYGFISHYKNEKIGYLVKALGVIGIIGFILATGINGPFGDINHWLYDNTILKGFRDSHKFVVMIVLAYAILGGLGIEKLSKKCEYDK